MNEGLIIAGIIASVSLLGMVCSLIDLFKKEEEIFIKRTLKHKPQNITEPDVLIDESLFDN